MLLGSIKHWEHWVVLNVVLLQGAIPCRNKPPFQVCVCVFVGEVGGKARQRRKEHVFLTELASNSERIADGPLNDSWQRKNP